MRNTDCNSNNCIGLRCMSSSSGGFVSCMPSFDSSLDSMDCTICATERSRREGFSASWVRREAHDPRNPVAGAVARVSDRRWRWVDTKKPFRRARPRFRISLLHFRLRRGYGRGGGTRELSGVAGATPLPGRLACHGGGLGCARHPNPRREVAPGQRSLQEGIQGMAGDHAVPASSADSAQPGEPVLRPLGSGARDTFRYGLVGWEYPCQVDARFSRRDLPRRAPRDASAAVDPFRPGSIIR